MSSKEVRLIDANALLEQTEIICGRYEVKWTDNRVMVWIDNAPTIDPESLRPHGKWILEREPDGKPYCFHCSVCDPDFHYIGITVAYDYCPNCGAEMEVDNV